MKRFCAALLLVAGFCLGTSGATHTLTIQTNGSGSVARNPTNSFYPHNAVVTLTALPAAGWQFLSWSGDISGSLNPTNVLMDSDKVIQANFTEIPSYTLTVNVSGGGSVSPPGGSFQSNTVLSLTATPSNGWIFYQWSGDASGSANPLAVTMSTNKSIDAAFVQPVTIASQPHDISASAGGTTNFTVIATGSGPLSYQWLFNNGPIGGATAATLPLANVQPMNAGDYRAVVSSPYGSVTSAVAFLAVTCFGTNVVSVASDAALRAAIAIGGHVRLCFSGTIALTNTIPVVKNTMLDAGGVSVAISGNGAVRLFSVTNNVTFSLTNLALIDGSFTGTNFNAPGGAAILNQGGTVQVVSCLFSNNAARDANGGAVACVGGGLTVTGSVFANNVVQGSVATPPKGVQGGAIYLQGGSAQISDSLLFSNAAVSDSTVGLPGPESTAVLDGGALAVLSSTVTLRSVRFLSNGVVGGFTRNGSIPGVGGGAIYNRGTMTAADCSFVGNQVQASSGFTPGAGISRGGAINNAATLILNGTTFHGNSCAGGFGRTAGFPGTDALGGALYGGLVLATNCTFTGNSARGGSAGDGGSPAGNAYGGAICTVNGGFSMTMVNVTIAGNTANAVRPFGSGGYSLGANIAATNFAFTLRNSLIAGSDTNANVWGPLTDGGYNMCSDGSANFSSGTSFNFTDPQLLPLANNGGPTLTMALAADSPAIDWAPAGNGPATDQRGFSRPSGAGIDLGAFEVVPPAPVLAASRNGSILSLSFFASAGATYELQSSTNLSVWQTQETISTNGLVVRSSSATDPRQFYRLKLSW